MDSESLNNPMDSCSVRPSARALQSDLEALGQA